VSGIKTYASLEGGYAPIFITATAGTDDRKHVLTEHQSAPGFVLTKHAPAEPPGRPIYDRGRAARFARKSLVQKRLRGLSKLHIFVGTELGF
jgi:hypothetical protein